MVNKEDTGGVNGNSRRTTSVTVYSQFRLMTLGNGIQMNVTVDSERVEFIWSSRQIS